MDDKDRDLIQQVLQAAGEAGTHGFSYLVHYKLIDGATDIVFGLILLGVTLWGWKRAFAWKPKSDHDWDDSAQVARGFLLVILTIVGVASLAGTLSGVTTVLAPEGAAIHSVLRK